MPYSMGYLDFSSMIFRVVLFRIWPLEIFLSKEHKRDTQKKLLLRFEKIEKKSHFLFLDTTALKELYKEEFICHVCRSSNETNVVL